MNCTVCGKPHSREQPLTVAHNDEWLCPGCLKELDTYSKPLYGKSPIAGFSGTIRVGDVELPIESFEMR